MRIFISGGTRGIGRALALRFVDLGFRVAFCARNFAEIPGGFGVFGDVANFADCERMFATVLSEFGGLDILVNNAAVAHVGYFADMQPDEWRRLIDVNLGGVVNLSHLAARQMLSQGAGQIVNISSIWGQVGASCEAVYSATKGGVNAFTRALAKELGPAGIRVNALACGVVDTEMNDFLSDQENLELKAHIPLGRFAKPEEIACAVEFLIKSEYITGQIITLDGGMI
ncbi:MAG: SDR family oxidoreductase [Clostridiales bacterium]|nr:SDR family oxidoreductase [Clostridiales bacterium]